MRLHLELSRQEKKKKFKTKVLSPKSCGDENASEKKTKTGLPLRWQESQMSSGDCASGARERTLVPDGF